MHEIRFCRLNEINMLQDFIGRIWKEGHIFSRDKNFLLWQHHTKGNENINFVVAYNEITKEFDGVLGFIATSLFDEKISSADIWLVIWKVKQERSSMGIGRKLFSYLIDMCAPESVGLIGMSDRSLTICKKLGYRIGQTDHYYLKNSYYKNPEIAHITSTSPSQESTAEYAVRVIDPFLIEGITPLYQFTPSKTFDYFINRYHHHPRYLYRFYGIFERHNLVSAFIARTSTTKTSSCLRIVDWVGNFTENIYEYLLTLICAGNFEYLDLVCHVPNKQKVLQMGFSKKKEGDIIPNYFEPYIFSNVEIFFAYRSTDNNYAFFKGDSDQDRPNI